MASAPALGPTACATVKPWEREQLGSRAMAESYGRDGTTAEHRDKVVRTKTAAI